MKHYICIFDCESIPDSDLIRKVLKFSGDDLKVSKDAQSKQKEETNSEFLPLPYHKIISICAVLADEFGSFIKVSKIEGESEKEMLENFFSFIDKYEPKLVSFNGKNFDLPLMVIRALKYNITAQSYLDVSNKWNNYKSKFSELKHCDLLESLMPFRGANLNLLCSMAGLPGKYDVSGDEVINLYYENKLDKIYEYCESDVLNTYMLFLKYELIKANLTRLDYVNYLKIMSAYLKEHRASSSYLEVFLQACENEINLSI